MKWVKNTSQYKTFPSELNILSKVANFTISPVVIRVKEYIAQTELACFGLREGKFNSLRVDIWHVITSTTKTKSSISTEEREAIKSLQTSVKDKDVLIWSQDKRCAILLDD